MPKVSVIIPVYNTAPYLAKCLDSVLNQRLKNVEIICINDGSSDSSLVVLNDYQERYDNILVLDQPNQGQAVARNRGMALAKGEFISFVDSDDWIAVDFLEKMYASSVENKADLLIATYPSSINVKTK